MTGVSCLLRENLQLYISVYDCVVLEDHNLMYVYIPLEIYVHPIPSYVCAYSCVLGCACVHVSGN